MIELNDTISALGWTLLHMAWITLFVAILIQIVRSFIVNPEIKYRLGISGIMTLPVIAIAIFTHLITRTSATPEAQEIAAMAGLFLTSSVVEHSTFSLIAWLNMHMDWLILFWFAGMMSFMMRLAFGFNALSRLRNTSQRLSKQWMDRFDQILSEYKINRPVLFGASRHIDSPLTFGFLKPAILLPVGLVSALTAEEVEAVIRHELAHIARHDFVFKMVQSGIESLFYYTPGTWWLSKMINIDREQCCDDYALGTGSSRSSYIKALYKVNTFQVSPYDRLALGFGKEKNQLLNRIKRILKQPQEKGNIMGRLIIPFLLVAIVAIISIKATSEKPQAVEHIEAPVMEVMYNEIDIPELRIATTATQDTTPKSKQKTVESQVGGNGKSYSITRENGKITRMEIDGKVIPEEDHDKYIKEFNDRVESDHFDFRFDNKFGDGTFEWDEESFEQFEKGMKEFEKSMESFGGNWDEWGKNMEEFEKQMEDWGEEFEMDEESIEKLQQWSQEFGEKFGKQFGQRFGEEFGRSFEWNFDEDGGAFNFDMNMDMDSIMKFSMKMMEDFSFNFDKDFDFSFPAPPTPPVPPAPPAPGVAPTPPVPPVPPVPPAAPFKLEMEALKKQLKKDGFFKDSDKVRFEMNEDELNINGKKQSSGVYKRYEKIIKEAWGKKDMDNFNINFNIDDKAKPKKSSYRI
ncbi:MAG: M48 family metalloprotease [Bacteroidia bacterium]|nr:M48 family metalloprotease [Bacteroidia bacterium]